MLKKLNDPEIKRSFIKNRSKQMQAYVQGGRDSSLNLPNKLISPTGFLSRLFLVNSLLIPTIPGPNGLWRIL